MTKAELCTIFIALVRVYGDEGRTIYKKLETYIGMLQEKPTLANAS